MWLSFFFKPLSVDPYSLLYQYIFKIMTFLNTHDRKLTHKICTVCCTYIDVQLQRFSSNISISISSYLPVLVIPHSYPLFHARQLFFYFKKKKYAVFMRFLELREYTSHTQTNCLCCLSPAGFNVSTRICLYMYRLYKYYQIPSNIKYLQKQKTKVNE